MRAFLRVMLIVLTTGLGGLVGLEIISSIKLGPIVQSELPAPHPALETSAADPAAPPQGTEPIEDVKIEEVRNPWAIAQIWGMEVSVWWLPIIGIVCTVAGGIVGWYLTKPLGPKRIG